MKNTNIWKEVWNIGWPASVESVFTVVFGIFYTFAREPIMLFFSRDPEVIRYGKDRHLFVAASLFEAAMMDVYSGVLAMYWYKKGKWTLIRI